MESLTSIRADQTSSISLIVREFTSTCNGSHAAGFDFADSNLTSASTLQSIVMLAQLTLLRAVIVMMDSGVMKSK